MKKICKIICKRYIVSPMYSIWSLVSPEEEKQKYSSGIFLGVASYWWPYATNISNSISVGRPIKIYKESSSKYEHLFCIFFGYSKPSTDILS